MYETGLSLQAVQRERENLLGVGILKKRYLRCFEKALFFEMGVKGEGILDSQDAHDFETDTIDKA